jgi:hypothetical protein
MRLNMTARLDIHLQTTKLSVPIVHKSRNFHAVSVTGKAGFKKSTAIEDARVALSISAKNLNAYSTPADFYNFGYENRDPQIVVDDFVLCRVRRFLEQVSAFTKCLEKLGIDP